MSSKYMLVGIGGLSATIFTLMRLSVAGWMFIIGLASAVLFGVLHLILLSQAWKHFDSSSQTQKGIAWSCVALYPAIFLFQFDFGDAAGSFFVYEYFTGSSDSEFESVAASIPILSASIYIVLFTIWFILKKNNSTQ